MAREMEAEHYDIPGEADKDDVFVSNGTSCRHQAGRGIHLPVMLEIALRKSN